MPHSSPRKQQQLVAMSTPTRSSTRSRRTSERLNVTPKSKGNKTPSSRTGRRNYSFPKWTKKSTSLQQTPISPIKGATGPIVPLTNKQLNAHPITKSSIHVNQEDKTVIRLQKTLDKMPKPCPSFTVCNAIGQGTFSTVYVARRPTHSDDSDTKNHSDGYPDEIAIKSILPTSSPDRIFTEIECLRLCQGKKNVVPLLFCHRLKGDVVLAMPYFKQVKFSETLRTITYVQFVDYMKNLLIAISHIHSLGIIHRDVKPNNFLYDFKNNRYALIDFGLAQLTGSMKPNIEVPKCKRKLSSGEFNNSSESPIKKIRRESSANENDAIKNGKASPKTPTNQNGQEIINEHYDRRMSLRRTPFKSKTDNTNNKKEINNISTTPDSVNHESKLVTPKKKNLDIENVGLRRSPRKHTMSRKATGYSKLTISANAIVGVPAPVGLNRTNSFTLLDPTSGVPSDYGTTPKLQASVTSCSMAPGPSSASRFNTSNLVDMARCECYGLPKVCSKCIARRNQKVPRAGTPGFRPPEVLLKFEHQTTSIDVWAAGVIMLSILSRTYPFFRAQDDLHNLAEIMAIFGTKNVTEVACQYGKKFICSENVTPVKLGYMINQLVLRSGSDYSKDFLVNYQSIDLCKKLLKLLSHERITAEEALKHPFFKGDKSGPKNLNCNDY